MGMVSVHAWQLAGWGGFLQEFEGRRMLENNITTARSCRIPSPQMAQTSRSTRHANHRWRPQDRQAKHDLHDAPSG